MNESSAQSGGYHGRRDRARRKRGFWTRVLGLTVLLWLARPAEAHAYIDPSTGSYLLQMLLAGLLAAAFAVKMFWQNLKATARRLFAKDRSHDAGDDSSTE